MNLTSESCTRSESLVSSSTYILAQCVQISICMATNVVVHLGRKFILKQLINKNAKILMGNILLSIVFHASIYTGTQLHHMIYDFLFVRNSCDYIFSNFSCLFVKTFTHCFTINLALLFISLCMERTMATFFLQNYNETSAFIFRVLPLLTISISISFSGIVFYVDAYDINHTESCLFNTGISWQRVNNMYYSLITINSVAMLWMFILYLKNRKLEKNVADASTTLNTRYQVKENLHITKVILLCGSVQLIVTLLHEVSNSVRRAYVALLEKNFYRELSVYNYLITYANLLFVLALFFLLKKQLKSKRNMIMVDINLRKNNSLSGYFSNYMW